MLIKSITKLVFIFAALGIASSASAVPDLFQNALALYNKQNYQACTPLLETYIRANPSNKVAYCYLANSYYALGKYDQAKKLAEYVIVNFSMTPESASCGELIARIQAKTEATKKPIPTADESRNVRSSSGSGHAFGNMPFNIDSVRLHSARQSRDRRHIARLSQESKNSSVEPTSSSAHKTQHSGCKVCVTPRMADKLPGFAHQRPRGMG